MKNNQKGFSGIIFIIIIVAILGVYYVYNSGFFSGAPSMTALDTSDWKTFSDSTHGDSIKFPQDFNFNDGTMYPTSTTFKTYYFSSGTAPTFSLNILGASVDLTKMKEVYSQQRYTVNGISGKIHYDTLASANGTVGAIEFFPSDNNAGDFVFTLSFRDNSQSEYDQNISIFKNILSTFTHS